MAMIRRFPFEFIQANLIYGRKNNANLRRPKASQVQKI